jgi:hypothetical protein
LRITAITDYKADRMKAVQAKSVTEKAPKKKRDVQQTEINTVERQRLEDLILRFGKVVVERNARLGQRTRAGVEEREMMRAGLAGLEQLDDEAFFKAVIKAQSRQ